MLVNWSSSLASWRGVLDSTRYGVTGSYTISELSRGGPEVPIGTFNGTITIHEGSRTTTTTDLYADPLPALWVTVLSL